MFRSISVSVVLLAFMPVPAFAQTAYVGLETAFIGRDPAAVCYESAAIARGDRESIRACTVALQQHSLSNEVRARTHVNRGVIRIAASDFERALRDFETARRLAPALAADISANRAAALIHLGQYREALSEANFAIDNNARDRASALYNRGVALEELGDVRGAWISYRAAASERPDWDMPRQELARFQVMELT